MRRDELRIMNYELQMSQLVNQRPIPRILYPVSRIPYLISGIQNCIVRWARKKSPWVLHYNSGGCNGCDIEILDLLTPRYDVERLGILKEASPRHADILLCTGPVTRQSRDRLERIYAQMAAPKWVVAVGSCGCSGGVFQGAPNVLGGIDQVLPVSIYIPGCPCRPEAVIDGLIQLLETL